MSGTDVGSRVRVLLARMTLREKTGQLNQRTGAFPAGTDRFAGSGAL